MKQSKKNAFTLIELIATLVIMAIIALIATPLIMTIIKKARVSADRRSIDAYGRSIELAIAGYLLDNGRFPTQISDLTIEYSGNEVVCSTAQLNSDSSVYLAGCTVAGRSVEDYTYGTEEVITYDAYNVGDEIAYNGVDYYVIKDSSVQEASVTLLKAEPLSVAQVNQYGGVGTANNHVNMYATQNTSSSYYQTAYNLNGYGMMQYYSSVTCTYYGDTSGCTTDYEQSEVKYVVDAWKNAKAPLATEARLITYDELVDSLGYDHATWNASYWQVNPEYTPSWVYNSNYDYWTMTSYNDLISKVWLIHQSGGLGNSNVYSFSNFGSGIGGVVRPVIVLDKSALTS